MTDLRAKNRGREAPLLLVGVDHRCAELDLRERVAYETEAAEELLARLAAKEVVEEALLLSTCNRTEIYLRALDVDEAFELALELVFVSRAPEIKDEGRFYTKHGDEATRHLLSVAAGLESMVLGEPEILGQVKQAVSLAEALGSTGAVLRHAGRTAVAAGRRSRAETGIGEGPVSFGYATVDLASSIFERLEECSVLTLGAGETATSVSRSLLERGAGRLVVANRSEARARKFADALPRTTIIPFDDRLEAITDADLVIAATSAPETILSRDALVESMRKRRNRPLLMVDLGVPRDIDPRARELPNLFLHDVDSLQDLIQRTLEERRQAVPEVSKIVDEELQRFRIWFGSLEAAPLVAQLHRRAERIRRQELATHRRKFPAATHDDLEALTRAIVRKLLHHPSTRLREGQGAESLEQLAALRDLFQLEDD